MEDVVCKQCGCTEYHQIERTFQNGTKHLEAKCLMCDSHIKFLSQNVENSAEFVLPFGKYKGKTIREIYNSDFGYLIWAKENLKNSVKQRILKAVEQIASEKE